MTTTLFFPGLGADSTLAKYHSVSGESKWIEWPSEIPDNWDDFADLLIRQIPTDRPLRFVGISFGGLAALKVAEKIAPVGGIFLIGSLTVRAEIRWPLRALLPLACWIPSPLFDLQLLPRWLIRYFFGIQDPSHLKDFTLMASRLPTRSVNALCVLVSRWQPVATGVVGRIHGKHDRILKTSTDSTIWVEGGHLISMTHPEEIRHWLQ